MFYAYLSGGTMPNTPKPLPERRIVSSRHLAEGEGWEASELEYGMIIAYNAFTRWMSRCMAAAGNADLTALEILVLHNTNHRDREKRLTDISFLLNIEDTHTVNYALRKLLKFELITAHKRGKEVFYSTSDAGAALCETYRMIRRDCFVDGLPRMDMNGDELRRVAASLRAISGQYDQASRAAASL
jgi:predicted MarR family transcription regulator